MLANWYEMHYNLDLGFHTLEIEIKCMFFAESDNAGMLADSRSEFECVAIVGD